MQDNTTTSRCSCCGADHSVFISCVKNQEGWIDFVSPVQTAMKCNECGHIDILPILSVVAEILYPADYLDRGRESRFFKFLLNRGDRQSVRELHASGFLNVLDFGSGSGTWVQAARKQGIRAVGYDPNVYDASGVVCNQLDKYSEDRFDLVRLEHVIEHLYDLEGALAEITSILKPGGTLQIATPNASAFTFRIFRSRWGYLHAPHHLRIFSPRSLEQTLARFGFVQISQARKPNLCTSLSIENVLRGLWYRKHRGHLPFFGFLLCLGLAIETVLNFFRVEPSAIHGQFRLLVDTSSD